MCSSCAALACASMELFEVAEEGSVGVRYVVGVLGLVYYLGTGMRTAGYEA